MTPTRLTLRAGVNRGPAFAGDVGALDAAHVRRHGRHRQPRGAAGRQGGAAAGSSRRRTSSSTRARGSRPRHEPFLVKGKDRPVIAYTVGAPTGVREQAVEQLPLVGREEELARAPRRRSTPRGCGSSSSSRSSASRASASRGSSRSCKTLALGFQQLETRCEAYESSNAFFAVRSLLRPLAGITPEQTPEAAGRAARRRSSRR